MEDHIKTQLGGSSLAGEVALLLMKLNDQPPLVRKQAKARIIEAIAVALASLRKAA